MIPDVLLSPPGPGRGLSPPGPGRAGTSQKCLSPPARAVTFTQYLYSPARPGTSQQSLPAPCDTSLSPRPARLSQSPTRSPTRSPQETPEARNNNKNLPSPSSAHTNPDWLKQLKKQFVSEVIEKCALKVRDAVANNSKIVDIKERRSVRNDIINAAVDRVIEIFGGVSRPRIGEMREIVSEMQYIYPKMFKEEDDDDVSGTGYGFGGFKGINGLANQMLDRVRSRDKQLSGSKKALDKGAETDGTGLIKKGKKKLIYGVNNVKWFCDKKPSATEAGALSRVSDEASFEIREEVYDGNRDALQAQFRFENFQIK